MSSQNDNVLNYQIKNVKSLEKKYDARFRVVFEAIRALMTPPEKKRPMIGFKGKEA
jgi:hypothetical protein